MEPRQTAFPMPGDRCELCGALIGLDAGGAGYQSDFDGGLRCCADCPFCRCAEDETRPAA